MKAIKQVHLFDIFMTDWRIALISNTRITIIFATSCYGLINIGIAWKNYKWICDTSYIELKWKGITKNIKLILEERVHTNTHTFSLKHARTRFCFLFFFFIQCNIAVIVHSLCNFIDYAILLFCELSTFSISSVV